MPKRVLPLIPAPLVVDHVEQIANAVIVHCRARSSVAKCPRCRRASTRLHSRYERRIADLPWQGRAVTIQLRVRRLRCANQRCSRRIFAETADTVVPPHGRRTQRLAEIQRCVGLALGDEAGAKLIDRLGMPTSADTMLRIVREHSVQDTQAPRILGVDDWAWRKGQCYGTVLINLETNGVVDLLPDRETATLATWLSDHPGVEIIARDRAGAYARGAREGAPAARQVADRWHLLRNCSDVLLNVVERRYRIVREVGKSVAMQNLAPSEMRSGALHRRKAERLALERREHRKRVFDRVIELRGLGWSQLAIRREMGIDLKTIRKWLTERAPGTWQRTVYKAQAADSFDAYLRQRWNEGCRNATQLYREVCEQGYDGDARNFRHWVKVRLRDNVPVPGPKPRKSGPPWRPPLSRQTTRLLTLEPDTLPRRERAFVIALCKASPDIAQSADLARRFQSMIQERDIDALAGWLDDTLASPLASLARGLNRDIDAVRAALTLPWSTGPVEGKINKLKLIKRSMYGRAGLDLLRARIMAT